MTKQELREKKVKLGLTNKKLQKIIGYKNERNVEKLLSGERSINGIVKNNIEMFELLTEGGKKIFFLGK